MEEIICNLHIHSTYSDGSGSYTSIAEAALKTDMDVIILTDHNVLVEGLEGYHEANNRKVLLLTGEEVHDQNRNPQKNHTLVFNANRDMAGFASDPQILINEVAKAGGLSFLAHPFEFDLPLIHEPDISWLAWEVEGYTGIELWNGLSEFKTVSRTLRDALKHLFLPELIAHAPLPATLAKWDDLLCSGKKINAIGGADAHAIIIKKFILNKIAFPYEFHFSAINNHLWIDESFNGNVDHDKKLVYTALKRGASFIGYDLPASTRGFRFVIENEEREFFPGEILEIASGANLKVNLPEPANLKLIHNGKIIFQQSNTDRLLFTVSEPGYYRVECTTYFLGKDRGWIYSNPIYVKNTVNRKVL